MSESVQCIVMGASAGAVEALQQLLPSLPAGYPSPIVVVVHIPPTSESLLSDLFASVSSLPMHEVEDKEYLTTGVYFAPPNYHVLIENNRTLSLSNEEPVLYSRPSIDVLFESAADAYGPALMGILLTGANDDGGRGLAAIAQAGGRVYVQDPKEAPCAAMPQAGLAHCKHARAMNLSQLAALLQKVSHAELAE